MMRVLVTLSLCWMLSALAGCDLPQPPKPTPTQYLDDQSVPVPADMPPLALYRDIYPYYTGYRSPDGDMIFAMRCDHTAQLCYGPEQEVIGPIDEAAILLPSVSPLALTHNHVRCRDHLCYDLRDRIVGSNFSFFDTDPR